MNCIIIRMCQSVGPKMDPILGVVSWILEAILMPFLIKRHFWQIIVRARACRGNVNRSKYPILDLF